MLRDWRIWGWANEAGADFLDAEDKANESLAFDRGNPAAEEVLRRPTEGVVRNDADCPYGSRVNGPDEATYSFKLKWIEFLGKFFVRFLNNIYFVN